jgi:hypothetical protein
MKYIVFWVIATYTCTFVHRHDPYGFPMSDITIFYIEPVDTLSRTFTGRDSALLFISGSAIHRHKTYVTNFIDTIWMDSTNANRALK